MRSGSSPCAVSAALYAKELIVTLGMSGNIVYNARSHKTAWAVITHIKHSDWYRDNYYADAKDGWYLNAGGTFHCAFRTAFHTSRCNEGRDYHYMTAPCGGWSRRD